MDISRTLGILALLTTWSSLALADDGAAPPAASPDPAQPVANADRTDLPSLPLFDLPARASDKARLHIGLAHARRDSRRAEHTRHAAALGAQPQQAHRAAANAHEKTAPSQLATARERQAAAQARRDATELRKAEAQERCALALDRRAAAEEHRRAATERQLNADALRAAAEERRANAAK